MIAPVPHEFVIGGVYFPPLLIAAIFGVLTTMVTMKLFSRYGLLNYFFYPPLVSMSLVIIFTILIGYFVIGV